MSQTMNNPRKVPFTPEQKAALAANPYTSFVNDYQIRFTVAFKKYLLAERDAHGTTWKEIFRKAGYDPDVLGAKRIENIVSSVRKEANSSKGLHETASRKNLSDKNLERQQMRTAIRDLQEEVIRLNQMVEFLKKTQQINALANDQHTTN